VIAIALMTSFATATVAHAGPPEKMPGLDDQVQEIKSDVLAIAAELRQLEEKLLYPSDTQVSIFVSLAEADVLELDSVHIQLDGEPAAAHVYSFKELEALRKGGVQRIYTGNLATGEHEIEVSIVGTLPGGARLDQTQSFSFSKDREPKAVGLTLAGQASGDAQIQLGDW
jgi:hypothetical protein